MNDTFLRHGPTRTFLFLLVSTLVAAHNAQATSAFAGTVSHVSDGDTLWVRPDAGGPPRKLRIDGIDAPEICQTGGEAALEVLRQLVLHQHVKVTIRRHDDYGRALARIRLDGHDLGAQMVQAGQAWSYRWRRALGPYAAEEALARQTRLGLFAQDQAELPRDFRQRHGSCHDAPR
jgi:endonuclease YncB( thermonuclease family)